MGDEGPSLVRSALLEALALKNFLLIEMRDEEPAFGVLGFFGRRKKVSSEQ